MIISIEAELYDVYGGDGIIRYEEIEKEKLRRTTMKKETRTDVGVSVADDETQETQTEILTKEIKTFKIINGKPALRGGGVHGKFWGALKESAAQLRLLGVKPFTSGYKFLMNMISVHPVWMPLETESAKIETVTLPQKLPGGKMIFERYDIIPRCKVKFNIEFPNEYEMAIKSMLVRFQKISLLNKRRATIKIISINRVRADNIGQDRVISDWPQRADPPSPCRAAPLTRQSRPVHSTPGHSRVCPDQSHPRPKK